MQEDPLPSTNTTARVRSARQRASSNLTKNMLKPRPTTVKPRASVPPKPPQQTPKNLADGAMLRQLKQKGAWTRFVPPCSTMSLRSWQRWTRCAPQSFRHSRRLRARTSGWQKKTVFKSGQVEFERYFNRPKSIKTEL